MKIIIKNFKTNSLISGIAFTLLGLLLAIFPTAASQFVGYILGAVLVVLGVISLVRYFQLSACLCGIRVIFFSDYLRHFLVCLYS